MTLPTWYTTYFKTPTVYDQLYLAVTVKDIKITIDENKKIKIKVTIGGNTRGHEGNLHQILNIPAVRTTIYPVPADFTGADTLKDDDPLPTGWGTTIAPFIFDIKPSAVTYTTVQDHPTTWEYVLSADIRASANFVKDMKYYAVFRLFDLNFIRSELNTIQNAST